jgi:8-oxo-dGTP pyrophosphatase MutT (NUDIX family)
MSAAQPKSASTVILLRSGEKNGIEVLLTRRPEAMDFLGGAYVFPGGTVRKDDCSESVQ